MRRDALEAGIKLSRGPGGGIVKEETLKLGSEGRPGVSRQLAGCRAVGTERGARGMVSRCTRVPRETNAQKCLVQSWTLEPELTRAAHAGDRSLGGQLRQRRHDGKSEKGSGVERKSSEDRSLRGADV